MEHARAYGIEIEFIGSRSRVAECISRLGVACQLESYNHNTRSHWKVVTDASLGSYNNAGEVVSPILSGAQGLRELELVCQGLEEAGATVNRSCGLHIHLDCRDLSVAECQTVFKRYSDYERNIDRIMPRSRRGNARWCGTIADSSVKRNNYSTKQSLSNAIGRYYKVNLTNIASRGSIEFRQHSGTVNFTKIKNWLTFLQEFMARSIELTGVARTPRRQRSQQRWYNELRTEYEQAGGSVTYLPRLKKWKFITDQGEIAHLHNELIETLYEEGSRMMNTGLRRDWRDRLRALGHMPPSTFVVAGQPAPQEDSLESGLTPETIDWLQQRAAQLN